MGPGEDCGARLVKAVREEGVGVRVGDVDDVVDRHTDDEGEGEGGGDAEGDVEDVHASKQGEYHPNQRVEGRVGDDERPGVVWWVW